MNEKTKTQDRFADAVCALGLLLHGDPAKVNREAAGQVIIDVLSEYERARGEMPLSCGHKLEDLIGGTELDGRPSVTKCGACLAERQKARSGS